MIQSQISLTFRLLLDDTQNSVYICTVFSFHCTYGYWIYPYILIFFTDPCSSSYVFTVTHTIPTCYVETGISIFLILYFINDPYIIARKTGYIGYTENDPE